jgi:tetratricopeptide (TPR) repeat protein/mono/diheme cytochrome c family protein
LHAIGGLMIAALITVGLSTAGSTLADGVRPAPPSVTFAEHVAPILFARCVECHRPDGPAPFSLLTFDAARRRATQIAAVTTSRYMPPWKPEPGFGSFVGARRLTDEQIATISAWVDNGMKEGDPSAAPPVPRWPAGWQLGEPDLIVTLPEYTLRGEGLDVFRNFVVSIPVAATRYVRGLEFRAGSPAVHHANIRIDRTPASRRLDELDPAPGYEGLILNSADYPDGHFLGWTPGQFAPLAPKGLAWRLAAGSDFVVQLHMRPTGRPERVQPALGLFFTDDAPAEIPAMLRLGRQNIDIPPGQPDYQSSDAYTLPVDAQVEAIQPHSHYRATQVTAWAVLPDASTRWLISIPHWDFEWQDVYRVEHPFWLPAGTRVFTRYVFDNSPRNPRNPVVPPQRALWGFKSSDEMGDVWIQVMTRNEADRARLVADFRRKATAEDLVGYDTRLREDPDNAALHDDAAVLCMELGQPAQALGHFEQVARRRPDSAAARFNVGTALEALERVTDAAAAYDHAARLDPSYGPARVNLGNMLLREGRTADAARQYREAVRVQPDNADGRNNLGRMLVAEGKPGEALEHLHEALRLRPGYVEAHFNLAAALVQSGEAAAGIAHYRDALAVRPDWTPALIALGWVLSSHPDASIRQPEEALRLALRAVELSERTDPRPLDVLAAAYASASQFDNAVATATTAADLAARAGASAQPDAIRARLTLYRAHRPYIETVR